MAKTGLLVLSNPSKISRIIPVIKEQVKSILYVQFSPPRQLTPPWTWTADPLQNQPNFGQIILGIYSQTHVLCQHLDVRVLLSGIKNPLLSSINTRHKIEIVFLDEKYSHEEVNTFMKHHLSNTTHSCQIVTVGETTEEQKPGSLLRDNCDVPCAGSKESTKNGQKIYENVVLGGTFDRLHAGHKILLTEALLHCSKMLTVGVTDIPMLKSKKLWELIQPCTKRMSDIRDFISDVDIGVNYNIVPINDPYGPTKEDPNLQMIVVSSETLKGGKKVNEVREQNGLPVLDIFCVELLESTAIEYDIEELKISSSNNRLRLLGSRLRTPEAKYDIPSQPYLIGLTGCIASGKTSVGKRLEGLGAGLINCDLIAHNLYKKNEACYHSMIQHFGSHILDSSGEVDRKVLGSIVFNDKKQLQKLNSLLWPAILERAKEEAQKLYSDGHNIVVMDAAVLVQAGWAQHCHEVWVCIIPSEEAVKRIQARNGLSVKDAEARLLNQPTNLELVSHANVVLCTSWEPEYTQKQVEKAWENLHTFLKDKAVLETKYVDAHVAPPQSVK